LSIFIIYSVSFLSKLEVLDVERSRALTTIPEGLFSIDTLETVRCEGCFSLTSPPPAVLQQGVTAVRKYLYDLQLEKGRNQRLIPVTAIGQSKAGKTSLVKSVQQNKRVLTERHSDGGKLDEATKVFKVCEAEVNESSKLVFTDFGGQAIYNFSYQLTFKAQCVPLLVIDIEEFDTMASSVGEEAASQDLALAWLAQLYLACPSLGLPVVVLTHRDKLSDECFSLRKQQLVDMTEKLRCRIIKDEKNVAASSSPVLSMTSFTDTSKQLMTTQNILDFSKESKQTCKQISDIENLIDVLTSAGSALITEIPASWYRLLIKMTSKTDAPFLTLSEIEAEFPDDEEHVALQYLHYTGRIMWFKDIGSLSNLIFHRPEVLTTLIETLYNHTQEEAWNHRLEVFSPYNFNEQTIERSKYEKMIEQFKSTGVMEGALLYHILEQESELPPEIGMTILQTFHLTHKYGNRYIVPYFANTKLKIPKVLTQLIPLRVDLFLRGLPIPAYVHSLITAAYLDINTNPFNHAEAGENGAKVTEGNGMFKYLLHDAASKRVTVVTLTPAKKICEAWKDQLSCLRKLTTYLKSVWKGVRYENVFYCAHCLLTNQAVPTSDVDPEWFSQTGKDSLQHQRSTSYTGDETCVCQHHGDQAVPRPLMYPCE
jgi:GTPase SAR1 family protein